MLHPDAGEPTEIVGELLLLLLPLWIWAPVGGMYNFGGGCGRGGFTLPLFPPFPFFPGGLGANVGFPNDWGRRSWFAASEGLLWKSHLKAR